MRAVNPTASIASGATMRERLMRSVNDRSFATLLVVFFAVAAILVIGIILMIWLGDPAKRQAPQGQAI
mgnify:CR=1 FL=1